LKRILRQAQNRPWRGSKFIMKANDHHHFCKLYSIQCRFSNQWFLDAEFLKWTEMTCRDANVPEKDKSAEDDAHGQIETISRTWI
jgi:hypothetical protein